MPLPHGPGIIDWPCPDVQQVLGHSFTKNDFTSLSRGKHEDHTMSGLHLMKKMHVAQQENLPAFIPTFYNHTERCKLNIEKLHITIDCFMYSVVVISATLLGAQPLFSCFRLLCFNSRLSLCHVCLNVRRRYCQCHISRVL